MNIIKTRDLRKKMRIYGYHHERLFQLADSCVVLVTHLIEFLQFAELVL